MSNYVLLTPLFHPQSIDYFSDMLLGPIDALKPLDRCRLLSLAAQPRAIPRSNDARSSGRSICVIIAPAVGARERIEIIRK
jgi:hypothetical protein